MENEFKSQLALPKSVIEVENSHLLAEQGSIIETNIKIESNEFNIEKQSIKIDGVCIHFYKKNIFRQQKLRVISHSGYIQMHFELSTGETLYESGEKRGSYLPIYQNQHMLFFEPHLDGYLTFPVCSKAMTVEIELSEEWLKKHFGEELTLLRDFAFGLKSKTAAILGGRTYPICSDIYLIIKQIYNCPYTGDLKKFFIESKLLELLAVKIHKAANTLETKNLVKISNTDKERLYQLKELLSSVKQGHFTIQQMTELTFMNRTKLQSSFKQLFGVTVHEFVVNKRMEEAYDLLKYSSDWTVAEVARHVGYKHYNHFSIAFKNKFGISPSKISN
ncbi:MULTISPECIES: helix-turn-helix domain-containing protein [Flavobacterium]|uniref:helix-turn-helix domain-containing protein n=1 Tax=Flavobacterium TaxID=237 RepID=UPI001181F90C|nr:MULTISPECIES: AraC family transcriptional regulator [Flavobacterium]MCR4033794.1 AraC family transcriptional regulator [Flavobacterium panacis]